MLGTEFGRTPRTNDNDGWDDQRRAFACLLAGVGIQGGERLYNAPRTWTPESSGGLRTQSTGIGGPARPCTSPHRIAGKNKMLRTDPRTPSPPNPRAPTHAHAESNLLSALCVLVLMSCQGSQNTASAKAENIALGKPVKLTPHSEYWLGDPPTPTIPNSRKIWEDTDAAVLVDGIHGSGDAWVQAATPCWAHAPRPAVTIDLGQVRLIDRVCFHAPGGGVAGVYFPVIAAVLVSENGTDYHLAGTAGSFGLSQDGKPCVGRFEVSGFSLPGRYVQLVLQAGGGFVSIDEVEVFQADAGTRSQPAAGQRPIGPEDLDTLFGRAVRARWVASEWQEIRDQIQRSLAGQRNLGAAVRQRMQDVNRQLASLDISEDGAIAAFRSECLDLRAEAARPLLGAKIVCWKVDPWADHRGSLFPPHNASAPAEISLSMWHNEYEHAALALANLESQATTIRVELSPLLDQNGLEVEWTSRLWLRQALAVPVRAGYRVLDALPLASTETNDVAEIAVPSGESRILWLTVHSLNLAPGSYQAGVKLAPVRGGAPPVVITLSLNVAALEMPDSSARALSSYAWDYATNPKWEPLAVTAAMDDLRAHGINTFMSYPGSPPSPRLNAERTAVESVDFTILDGSLDHMNNPRLLCTPGDGWPADLSTPALQECFRQYIRIWAEHLAKRGLGPDRFFFYFADEGIPEKLVQMAKLVKEVDPRLQTFCNQVDAQPEKILRVAPYIDIWCPYYRHFTEAAPERREAFREALDKYGAQLWTYACDGPGKTLSPNTYYRRLSWCAFDEGATGAGFWTYADGYYFEQDMWNDFDGSDPDFGVVYFAWNAPEGIPRGEPIIPSRRWEAWREGTEDYEYLHRLREAINTARKSGAREDLLRQAERVLRKCVQDVMREPTVSDRYDRARKSLTEAILQLRQINE